MPDRPASELLRELEARVQSEQEERHITLGSVWLNSASRIWLALPAIIALVEAAERVASYDAWELDVDADDAIALTAALVDLRKELGGGA